MMGELILRNLLHRPMRTLIGALGVAVEVALVILIVGLTSGLLTETAKRIEGIGADIMLQPPAASIIINFADSFTDFYRHGRAAEIDNDGGGGRLEHDVGPDAFDSLGGFGEQAAGQANDEDHQGNLHGDAHRADERAHRAVQEVAKDAFAHHWGLLSVAGLASAVSPTWTNSDPAGCSSLKRSAGISSLTVIFATCNSSL